jgi:hypothetical protein
MTGAPAHRRAFVDVVEPRMMRPARQRARRRLTIDLPKYDASSDGRTGYNRCAMRAGR